MEDQELIGRLKKSFPDLDPKNFNVFDFLHAVGSPLQAILYSRLFWPEFVEIEGMVLLKETIEDAADRQRLVNALTRFGGDRQKTEQSFNLVEIPSLFGRLAGESSDQEDQWLAERLVQMWHARLRQSYPDRVFVVKCVPPEVSGGEVAVVFYQARRAMKTPQPGQEARG